MSKNKIHSSKYVIWKTTESPQSILKMYNKQNNSISSNGNSTQMPMMVTINRNIEFYKLHVIKLCIGNKDYKTVKYINVSAKRNLQKWIKCWTTEKKEV